jgi:Leucine-rich repeat (LRR) protein
MAQASWAACGSDSLGVISSTTCNCNDAAELGYLTVSCPSAPSQKCVSIAAGTFTAGGANCLKVITIHGLSNQNLQTLVGDVFVGLTNLITLDLSRNILQYVNMNAFNGLYFLESLDLSYNRIAYVDIESWFAGNARLLTLTVSHNLLTAANLLATTTFASNLANMCVLCQHISALHLRTGLVHPVRVYT